MNGDFDGAFGHAQLLGDLPQGGAPASPVRKTFRASNSGSLPAASCSCRRRPACGRAASAPSGARRSARAVQLCGRLALVAALRRRRSRATACRWPPPRFWAAAWSCSLRRSGPPPSAGTSETGRARDRHRPDSLSPAAWRRNPASDRGHLPLQLPAAADEAHRADTNRPGTGRPVPPATARPSCPAAATTRLQCVVWNCGSPAVEDMGSV